MMIIESLSELKLSDKQKKAVLEWYAYKIWQGLEEGSGEPDYYGKSYDPLDVELETKTAHSYVFNLNDGGRHHDYDSLEHLEKMLDKELINGIKAMAVK